ncbi:MAG: redoxin domain-containing protein [Acidobacteria bacterium]|nr:redoxin domain-containing protein [Acidobacteriota bacterium]
MKPHNISWAVVLLIAGLFTQVLSKPQSQQPIDVSKLGPQVGQQAPDFSLKDQTGKTWTLQSIMGSKGAMLVFVRSADW